MNNIERDTAIDLGKTYLNGKWVLNTYLIRSNPEEVVSKDIQTRLIEKHILLLEENCMSDEFDYYRTGFAFLHFGNRGVDLTIWHIGRWGNTFETFICSWYCYDRDIWNMEQLNAAEPMLCQYEMKWLIKEINIIAGLSDYKDLDKLRSGYLSCSKEQIHNG